MSKRQRCEAIRTVAEDGSHATKRRFKKAPAKKAPATNSKPTVAEQSLCYSPNKCGDGCIPEHQKEIARCKALGHDAKPCTLCPRATRQLVRCARACATDSVSPCYGCNYQFCAECILRKCASCERKVCGDCLFTYLSVITEQCHLCLPKRNV